MALESHAGCSNNAGAPTQSGIGPVRPAVDSSRHGALPGQRKTEPRPLCKEKRQHSLQNSASQTTSPISPTWPITKWFAAACLMQLTNLAYMGSMNVEPPNCLMKQA